MITRRSFPLLPAASLAKNPVTAHPQNTKLGGAPVVFSAQATLAAGKSVVLNAQTLQSGFRTPYFIDEIRVSMHTNSYAAEADGVYFPGLSGLVSILFQTGKYAFSADAVPVGLLAPIFGTDYGMTTVSADGTIATDQYRGTSTVRWMLPKALFMPAGDVILANVALADLPGLTLMFGTDPCVTVTVTYIGRLVPQGWIAPTRAVPWLAWWTKTDSEEYKTATTRLRNPFTIPVHVQRFTQRTYSSYYAPPFAEYNEIPYRYQLTSNTDAYQSIHISDSRGYEITNKRVAIGDVFDTSRHAWTFGRELGSREQFNMEMVTENFAAIDVAVPKITNVGVVGYRLEAP